MQKTTTAFLIGLLLFLFLPILSASDPEADREKFWHYFEQRFPEIDDQTEYGNGAYAIDEINRAQWLEIEEFPPYELDIERGEELYEIPFANGKGYADCFENEGIGIRQNYPYFDKETKQIITLELAINQCREANGEKPLKYKKGDIAAISAYMAYTSRGELFDLENPADDPEALAWYEKGKEHFYAKRGQLNLACADCHVYNSGMMVRADRLSPALGHVTHFPVYRSKWSEIGTLHRRFGGCNEQVRSKSFKPQSEEYRALEYFLTYMSNGLPVNGPGTRR